MAAQKIITSLELDAESIRKAKLEFATEICHNQRKGSTLRILSKLMMPIILWSHTERLLESP